MVGSKHGTDGQTIAIMLTAVPYRRRPEHRCGPAFRQGRRREQPVRMSLLLPLLTAKEALKLGGELVA